MPYENVGDDKVGEAYMTFGDKKPDEQLYDEIIECDVIPSKTHTENKLDQPSGNIGREKQRICHTKRILIATLMLVLSIVISAATFGVEQLVGHHLPNKDECILASWSSCAKTDGIAMRNRKLNCPVLQSHYNINQVKDVQLCDKKQWDECTWMPWSHCTKTDGIAKRTREFHCQVLQSINNVNQVNDVTLCDKEFWDRCAWTPWSRCTKSRGVAQRTRELNCPVLHYRYFINQVHDTQLCNEDQWDVFTMDFTFKRSSLYKYWYINADNTLITNVKTSDTVWSQGAGFQNYLGVMADKCCAKNEEMSFGIQYKYDIRKKLAENYLIMEVGLAENIKIDNYFYVGNTNVSGWSFVIQNNEFDDVVSMYAEKYPSFIRILNHISANTPGTNKTGIFHFNINRTTNTFSVLSNQIKLYTFTNIMSEKDLCPVFGLYNPPFVNVSLRLLYSTFFT